MGKNVIGALITQLLSGIRVDMAHHQVNLLLGILSDIHTLWDDSADHFVIVFAVGFLIRGTGITVKYFGTYVMIISAIISIIGIAILIIYVKKDKQKRNVNMDKKQESAQREEGI